jgi:haloalkane dehalogenase
MMVLEKNLFVESVLPGAILRKLTKEEMAVYRAPFVNTGEDRRPTLTWPRQIPIEGEPPEVVRVATDCGRWLAESRTPKLFINAEPGRASEPYKIRVFNKPFPERFLARGIVRA